MPRLGIVYDGKTAGETLKRNMTSNSAKSQAAMRGTAEEVAQEILQRGRTDIQQAGRYGARWTQGLQANVTSTGQGDFKIEVLHTLPYFSFYLKGGVIKGNPLLWLPFSFAGLEKGQTPRDLSGTLFRVNRTSGDPILMSRVDRMPMFLGKTSVTMPRKFHTIEIIRQIMNQGKAKEIYSARFASG